MGVLLSGILRNVSDLQVLGNSNKTPEYPSLEACNYAPYNYCSSCKSLLHIFAELKSKESTQSGNTGAGVEADNVATRPPQLPLVHDVLCGETLSSISQLYGVSVDAIMAHNEIRDANRIYAGSALQIPGVITEFLP